MVGELSFVGFWLKTGSHALLALSLRLNALFICQHLKW
jgi:hypothetical protein